MNHAPAQLTEHLRGQSRTLLLHCLSQQTADTHSLLLLLLIITDAQLRDAPTKAVRLRAGGVPLGGQSISQLGYDTQTNRQTDGHHEIVF